MLLLLISSLIFLFFAYHFSWKRRNYPPGPTPLPLVGNLLQLQKFGYDIFHKWKKEFGPVFTFWLGKWMKKYIANTFCLLFNRIRWAKIVVNLKLKISIQKIMFSTQIFKYSYHFFQLIDHSFLSLPMKLWRKHLWRTEIHLPINNSIKLIRKSFSETMVYWIQMEKCGGNTEDSHLASWEIWDSARIWCKKRYFG